MDHFKVIGPFYSLKNSSITKQQSRSGVCIQHDQTAFMTKHVFSMTKQHSRPSVHKHVSSMTTQQSRPSVHKHVFSMTTQQSRSLRDGHTSTHKIPPSVEVIVLCFFHYNTNNYLSLQAYSPVSTHVFILWNNCFGPDTYTHDTMSWTCYNRIRFSPRKCSLS